MNYNPLAGSSYSSYIKLAKEVDHPSKSFVNIQNTNDNECFEWCLVRYLYPTYHNPRKIKKVEKLHWEKIDFKDVKFPVIFTDI